MANTRGERQREARKKRFKSARSAALALALPISSHGAHERAEDPGGRDYGPDEARRYARYFGVTAEWLLTGYESSRGRSNQTSTLAIVGYIGTGGTVHLYSVKPDQAERIETPFLASVSTVGLEIRDPSLFRMLPRGWVALFDHDERRPSGDLIGKLCIVARDNNRLTVEMLREAQRSIRWAALVKAILPR